MYVCINQRVLCFVLSFFFRAPAPGIGTTWTLGDAEAWILWSYITGF